jgi:transposase
MISGCIPNSLIGINPGGRSAVCARIVEMIRKVYEVDPMVCPKCGGTKKVIAFITEVAVVDRIIDHLKLRFVAEKPLAHAF